MKNNKEKWAGDGGIGSGFTGGDHLAYQVMLPGSLLGVFFGIKFMQALINNPDAVALLWGPVMVFGAATFLMRRRSRTVFIMLLILALVAAVLAVVSAFAPASSV